MNFTACCRGNKADKLGVLTLQICLGDLLLLNKQKACVHGTSFWPTFRTTGALIISERVERGERDYRQKSEDFLHMRDELTPGTTLKFVHV
jgi:hypothetical protein